MAHGVRLLLISRKSYLVIRRLKVPRSIRGWVMRLGKSVFAEIFFFSYFFGGLELELRFVRYAILLTMFIDTGIRRYKMDGNAVIHRHGIGYMGEVPLHREDR
jgi:hypothetical protein